MQNRHPLEQELDLLLQNQTIGKEERARKLEKILTCFKISNDNYNEQVAKYNETLTTHGYKLFDLSLFPRADINAQFSSDQTALMLALNNKDEDSVLTLLNANANPNTPSKWNTPLTCATHANFETGVSHLLKKNAEVNTRRKDDGATALLIAASWNYTDLVAILLNSGADYTAVYTPHRKTALDYAVYHKNLSTINLLLEKGAAIRNPNAMQKFLMSQDQNNDAVIYCYTKLTQCSISSNPNSLTQVNNLTLSEIISRIQIKIKESRSNDTGFLSLFRDVDFSAKQIKIATDLILRLESIDTSLNSAQLKIKIASEFETALHAFTLLLAEKNKTGRVGTRALDPHAEKSMAGTRFHATILALAKDISNSTIEIGADLSLSPGNTDDSFELLPIGLKQG